MSDSTLLSRLNDLDSEHQNLLYLFEGYRAHIRGSEDLNPYPAGGARDVSFQAGIERAKKDQDRTTAIYTCQKCEHSFERESPLFAPCYGCDIQGCDGKAVPDRVIALRGIKIITNPRMPEGKGILVDLPYALERLKERGLLPTDTTEEQLTAIIEGRMPE